MLLVHLVVKEFWINYKGTKGTKEEGAKSNLSGLGALVVTIFEMENGK